MLTRKERIEHIQANAKGWRFEGYGGSDRKMETLVFYDESGDEVRVPIYPNVWEQNGTLDWLSNEYNCKAFHCTCGQFSEDCQKVADGTIDTYELEAGMKGQKVIFNGGEWSAIQSGWKTLQINSNI